MRISWCSDKRRASTRKCLCGSLFRAEPSTKVASLLGVCSRGGQSTNHCQDVKPKSAHVQYGPADRRHDFLMGKVCQPPAAPRPGAAQLRFPLLFISPAAARFPDSDQRTPPLFAGVLLTPRGDLNAPNSSTSSLRQAHVHRPDQPRVVCRLRHICQKGRPNTSYPTAPFHHPTRSCQREACRRRIGCYRSRLSSKAPPERLLPYLKRPSSFSVRSILSPPNLSLSPHPPLPAQRPLRRTPFLASIASPRSLRCRAFGTAINF
ncbi:hypothetical protein BV25DRAFT_690962 [Artomyces pyxidatus]|uniref:Uncharacterized protein n=1 Tax=Artomyces pyxidatus TaxID=48021 RepID=A0ACB8SZV3_9AGAM|nr:hypothetical protein BV25DRAFT_690962 [Artomyces pyxidatus]